MAGCMWVVAGIIVNATIHRTSWDLSTTLLHDYCEHAFDQVSRGIMVRFGFRLKFRLTLTVREGLLSEGEGEGVGKGKGEGEDMESAWHHL